MAIPMSLLSTMACGDEMGLVTSTHKGDKEMTFRLTLDGYGETQEIVAPKNIVTLEEVERRKDRSGIPAEYSKKSTKDFDFTLYNADMSLQKGCINDYILNYDKRYLLSGNGLYIYSKEQGTGKTFLACVIGNELMSRYAKNVKFVTAQDYIEMQREKKSEQINVLKNCGILILDDLGSESTGKKDDWTKNVIYRLVDWRVTNHLSTIYTSNYSYKDINEDVKTMDRIANSSVPVPLPDVPIRRNKGIEYINDFLKDVRYNENEDLFK